MLRIVASGNQRCGPDTAATPHHDDTKESSCSHRSSTAGTATLPTGSGTRGSCLLDGPSPPTSPSSSPPRTRGDYPPLTTTSPPSNGAHGLSTTTRACPARRARARAVTRTDRRCGGTCLLRSRRVKRQGAIHKLRLPGCPCGSLAYVPCPRSCKSCAGGVPGRCRRVYLSIPGRGCEIGPPARAARKVCPR